MSHMNNSSAFRVLSAAEVDAVAGGFLWERPPVVGEDVYFGKNSLVPDSWENWYYGRRADGSGGAWEQDGDQWTYYDSNGDPVKSYEETTQNDPAITRTVTFESSSSITIGGGGIERDSSNSTSTTIYLRPIG